jgi:predicted hotdog family 3-hydroxylacyl-ACP dehydratase
MKTEALLPHGGDMRLVDELVSHGEGEAHVRVRLTDSHPFLDEDRQVPAWLGLEMMAQAVAAWSGERGRAAGEPPRMGYLLACRSFDAEVPGFAVPATLDIHMHELMRQDNGFGSYSGEIQLDGRPVARGKLSVMESEAPTGRGNGENE